MKKKEDARLAILCEYDRWAKDHPNDAKKMGGFVFFGYLEKRKFCVNFLDPEGQSGADGLISPFPFWCSLLFGTWAGSSFS